MTAARCRLHPGALDDRSYGLTRLKIRLLRDVAHAGSLAHGDVAAIGFQAAFKNLQKRGLAGAVRTNQSDTVAFRHRKGNVPEERCEPKGFRDLLRVNKWRHFVA